MECVEVEGCVEGCMEVEVKGCVEVEMECVEVERCVEVEVECVEVEGVWMDREVCDVHVGSEAERHTYSVLYIILPVGGGDMYLNVIGR